LILYGPTFRTALKTTKTKFSSPYPGGEYGKFLDCQNPGGEYGENFEKKFLSFSNKF
jgi:hypothetical protein